MKADLAIHQNRGNAYCDKYQENRRENMILRNITEDQAKDLAGLTIIAKRDKKALKMAQGENSLLQ